MGCESRVYLSKSNLADDEHLHKVRVYLMELGYSVIEWNSESGEEYTEHPMLECDLMVMVGYDLNEDDIMEVGKGQYNQLIFREHNGFGYEKNLYFVGFDSIGDPLFYSVETMSILDDKNWKEGYGQLQLIDEALVGAVRTPEKQVDAKYHHKMPSHTGFHLACINLLKP